MDERDFIGRVKHSERSLGGVRSRETAFKAVTRHRTPNRKHCTPKNIF